MITRAPAQNNKVYYENVEVSSEHPCNLHFGFHIQNIVALIQNYKEVTNSVMLKSKKISND